MTNIFLEPDKEKNYQSYMVYVLAIIWSVVTGLIISLAFYFLPHLWLRWATLVGLSLFIAVFNLSLNRFGYTRLASWSLTIMLWLYITIPCFSAGGIMAPGIISQMSVILTAGFLLGWRGGLSIGLLTMVTDFVLAYLEVTGHLAKSSLPYNPINRWIGAVIPFGTIIALQYYATNHLRTGLIALQREVLKREEAEKIKDQTVYNLGERVKELKTLYAVSRILQEGSAAPEKLLREIGEVLPAGWQYPGITAARVCIAGKEYATYNYHPSEYCQRAEMKTTKGTNVEIEIVYLQPMPEIDEGPFLQEERSLINMLAEMIKTDLERRERKAELKDYKYALDTASIVSISNVDGYFTFVNENFCKISKYSAEELIGKQHDILWSGYHSPEYFMDLAIVLQESKTYTKEFCNKAKDGTLYWVDATIIPFLDENGKVYQYLSINYDITERKEADLKLQQSEEKNRALIENIAEAIVLIDEDENMIFQSPAVTRITGYQPEDSYGKKSFAFIHPDEVEGFRAFLQQVLNSPGKPMPAQFRIIHKKGHTIWLEGTLVNMLHNESIKSIVINYRDVTENREAEETIRESEQLLRKITSQVPGNTYMFEIEESGHSTIIFGNRGTDDYNHSYDLEELKTHPEQFREVLHEDDKVKFNDAMKAAWRTRVAISFQYRIIVNNSVRWRWMQAVPEKNKDGKIIWYGATSDITPLVDYIVSIEQIVFDIGHVIRRPISSMMGMTRLINDNDLAAEDIKEISRKLYPISEEMDKFIRELNLAYYQKRQNTKFNIDISSLIDKRSSLFE